MWFLRVFCWYQTTISEATWNTQQDELHMQGQQQTHECERLKKEESQRQALALQMQQLQLECKDLRMKHDELYLQVQQLTSDLKEEEEYQRQAVTLEMKRLQLECDNLKKKEFKFKSLVAAAHSLKSKVEQFCNECEKCDAEDASSDSSWEFVAARISIDTASRCFKSWLSSRHRKFLLGK